MWSSLLLKRFGLTNLQKRSWLRTKLYPNEKEIDRDFFTKCSRFWSQMLHVNAICHYDFSFLLRRCVFLLVFPSLLRRSLFVSKEKESARDTMGRGNREERPLPAFSLFPYSPRRFLFFYYCFFIGIPIGNLCGGEGFPLFPKTNTSKFQFNFWFLTLDVIADVWR